MTQNNTAGKGNSQNEGLRGRMTEEAGELVAAMGGRAMSSVQQGVEHAAKRLTDYADNGASPGLKAAVTGARDIAEGKSPTQSFLHGGLSGLKEKAGNIVGRGGKGNGNGGDLKLTNIEESVDIGAPISVVYGQWTQYTDFPGFMKKVEKVEQTEDTKLKWRTQILWSHREWESTILEQVPDEKIIWRSDGQKGYVDGAVTFHELAPNLTRALVTLEYHPQGFFEQTGNLWRAQGRRVRLELKHFRRHVMSEVLQHPEEVEGKRDVIRGGEVVPEDKNASSKRGAAGRSGGTNRGGNQRNGSSASGQRRSGSRNSAGRGGRES